MFIKRFVVKSLPLAMAAIREELGADAIILSSRKIRAAGIWGWFGRMNYEVVAAVDERSRAEERKEPERAEPRTEGPRMEVPRMEGPRMEGPRMEVPRMEGPPTAGPPREAAFPAGNGGFGAENRISQELADIRKLLLNYLSDGPAGGQAGAEWFKLTSLWMSTGLSKSLAERFLSEYADVPRGEAEEGSPESDLSRAARNFVEGVMESALPPRTIEKGDRIVALIGPTGVGKTTTVAKLVASARLREGRQVGLLTLDTFRVAAAEQLRTYAGILNVPFAVAHTANEVQDALASLSDCDLVFVDTAGRSFLTPDNVAELKALLDEVPVDLTYLVVSLTSRSIEACEAAKVLEDIGYDALLFTKSDEALTPSLTLTMVENFGKPLSYITTGQRVPDDITVADSDWLAPRLAGGEHRVGSS